MSISSEISRISQNVSDSLAAVAAKGVTVPTGSTSDDLPDLISQITGGGSATLNYVTPEDYGAVGDGTTDDSQAVQDACDAGYNVYFASNKTYYLADTVTIDHDVHLFGGENTVIKTEKPSGGSAYNGIVVSGTLKKTTTLTTDYTSDGNTDNCNNKFTLEDMTDINIGDIMVIQATDQYYHYARDYYYLGAALLITDNYDDHVFTSDSMPYNIENTENVSVKIYSAPKAIIENITFESSGFDGGNYRYLLSLVNCKNSSIKNCTFTEMDNGANIVECVNSKIDTVLLSKCKYNNSLSGDGYGIVIDSCTNTDIERVLATCAQHAISITGHLPSINTFVRQCELTSECRNPGFDTHEAIYNLVIEDCVLGTAALNGSVHVNRCKVINNRRVSTGSMNVSVYGSHNEKFSKIIFENTTFEGTSGVSIMQSGVQSPVASFDNVYGEIRFENCTGGALTIMPETNSTILSNTIKYIEIRNWKNCKDIYNTGDWKAVKFIIADSSFIEKNFINDHNASHGVVTSNIEYLDVSNTNPLAHKVTVSKDTNGENLTLPKDVQISLSSSNSSAKYVVCGVNLTSNNIDDYCVGQVGGSAGGALSRTEATGSGIPSLSLDLDGNIVYSQGSGAGSYCIYPVGMFYVKEPSSIQISVSLVNSGVTSGASFRPAIAAVDCKTGKLIDRFIGTGATASAQGESISHSYFFDSNVIAMCYLYCNSPVALSETTFENLSIICTPAFAPAVINEPYQAHRRTGDGTISSLAGVNNIMCSDQDFHVELKADYVNNPIGLLPSATGVSF